MQRLYKVGRFISSVKTLFSAKTLSSVETFIQCGDFFPVRRLISSAEIFIQYGDFYPVQRLYPVRRPLSSAETHI